MRLETTNGLDCGIGDDLELEIHARDRLEGVHKQRARATQARGSLARDDRGVRHDHRTRGAARDTLAREGGRARRRVVLVDARLLHDALESLDLVSAGTGALELNGGLEIAAHDLHAARVTASVIVSNGKAHHVDTHVRRALVGALAQDPLHQGAHHGEGVDVAVVVDRHLAVGLEMEGVDDVGVVEVSRGSLVGDVHGVGERQVPHGERLELRIAGFDAALVLVIDLREAGRELAGARAGRRHHNERARGLDELVPAIALVGDDEVDVVGIAVDGIVQLAGDAEGIETTTEGIGGRLAGILRDNHARDGKALAAEQINEAQRVLVIGDAEVSPRLVLLDVVGVDRDDDLGLGREALEHAELGIGLEAGKHAARVVVVEQLAAKLEVELAAKLVDALADA